ESYAAYARTPHTRRPDTRCSQTERNPETGHYSQTRHYSDVFACIETNAGRSAFAAQANSGSENNRGPGENAVVVSLKKPGATRTSQVKESVMKKILVLGSLLIAAAACSTTPSGNKDVTTNANSANDNKGTEIKSAALVSESDIIAKEKASWDAIKQKDWDGFGRMLAGDYLEILDDGVHDQASALTSIKDFDLSD